MENSIFMSDVGNVLASMRIECGLSQEDLALETDMATSTVHRYESGKRNIPLDAAYRLTKAMGHTPDELLADYLEIDKKERYRILHDKADKLIDALNTQELETVVKMLEGLSCNQTGRAIDKERTGA